VRTSVPEFGSRVAGVEYRIRPGGYVLLFDSEKRLAVIETANGVFLPAGGQSAGETPEDAALRETREELGLRIHLLDLIGVADELVFGTPEMVHFRKRCTFFAAVAVGSFRNATAENMAEWLAAHDATRVLSHGSQRWAAARILEIPSIPNEVGS